MPKLREEGENIVVKSSFYNLPKLTLNKKRVSVLRQVARDDYEFKKIGQGQIEKHFLR